jgi:HK97 family phage major capsid protein
VLGDRMLRDLGAKVDNGLLQGTGAADVLGLFNQPSVSTTSVAALPTNLDKVAEAEYQLATNDGHASAWIMHPRTWRILRKIKTGIASDNRTLLEPDPELAPQTLSGLPVFTSSQISITSGAGAGSTAAVVDASQIVIVTRRAPRLEISRDYAFNTDAVAIRATTRIGLGVIDPAGGVSLLTDIRAS